MKPFVIMIRPRASTGNTIIQPSSSKSLNLLHLILHPFHPRFPLVVEKQIRLLVFIGDLSTKTLAFEPFALYSHINILLSMLMKLAKKAQIWRADPLIIALTFHFLL